MTAPAALSARLRESCAGEWEALHRHPFVQGLGDGSLPLDAFRFYLEQNLQYLPEYGRAIALAAGRARHLGTMAYLADELVNIVAREIPQNAELLRRAIELGAGDRGGAADMAPATVAYTSFLVAVAARSGPLEVLAAVVPCTWSYGDIGSRLLARLEEHPLYSDWIRFFGSTEYAEVVASMRGEFDRLGSEVDEHGEDRLRLLFAASVRLERDFWGMAFRLGGNG